MIADIRHPDLLLIHDQDPDNTTFGCDQDWYAEHWQRQAGCGPCTAATLLYYLARSHSDLGSLYTAGQDTRVAFTRYMADIWHFVTPGKMGVNEASILADGVIRFAAGHQISLAASIQKVPPRYKRTAPFQQFMNFVKAGLDHDCPVAFLNLSNGHLPNLESWHWVTLTGLEADGRAVISDSGERKVIDLAHWYGTSWLGGAAVWFTASSAGSLSLVEDLRDR